MSGGGGGSKSTTTVQKADPWKGVQPFLTQGFESAASLYGTPTYDKKGGIVDWQLGQGPQYFPNQTVATPNWLEQFGQSQQLGAAGNAANLAGQAQGGLGALLGAPGQTQFGLGQAQGAANFLQGTGENMLHTGFAQANQGQGLGQQAAQEQIGAGGVMRDVGFNQGAVPAMQRLLGYGDPSSNPYFAAAQQAAIRPLTEQFTEQVLPSIRQGAIAAGGLGGSRQGIAEGIASRGYQNAVADAMARMGMEAYGQGIGATQAAGSLGANLLGQGIGAIGQGGQLGLGAGQLGQGMAGLGQAGVSGAGGLGASLYGTGLESGARGAALAPQIQQMGFVPGQTAERIGQQRTADEQAQIDAEIARWNYGQNLPYNLLSDYMQLLQGGAGLGGTQTQQASGGGGSMLGRVGGGALTGAGLLSASPGLMPWGALGGGLLGLFG